MRDKDIEIDFDAGQNSIKIETFTHGRYVLIRNTKTDKVISLTLSEFIDHMNVILLQGGG